LSFLRSIAKLFNQEPLIVRMTLAPSGVSLALYEGTHILEHDEILSDKIQTKLTPPLATLVKNQPVTNKQPYLIALPHAQKLLTDLKRYASDKIQLDCGAVENLKQIAWPTDFRIHWRYDAVRQRLEPQFSGADHHLGYGWFHRQQQIWALSNNPSDPIIGWLNRAQITGSDIFQFVSTILPAGQRANLPLSCDLSIEIDFHLKLTIVKMLKKSLEVELTANLPAVLAKLQYLDGDPQHMISGTKLLPDLRPHITPQIFTLAHLNAPTKIEGSALPDFLQYEIKPNATFLGVDMATLETTYPIVDVVTLDLVWKLEREDSGGIGRYRAIPWLEAGPISIQFKLIADEILRGTRFVRVNDYWLEFTEVYKKRHRNWLNQLVALFQLSSSEILGVPSERFKATGLKAPRIEHKATVDQVQTTKDFLTTMSYHGLPVALAGLQKEMPNLLAWLCQKLLQQSTSTRVLWIVAKTRLPIIQSAMKAAGVPTYSGFPARPGKSLAGGVYLVLPFVTLPTNIAWDLLIIQEIDALSLNEEQTRLYSVIQRLWSITTFEKTQRVEQDRQFRQAMQILQIADAPLDIFRRRCLLVGSDQEEGWLTRLTSPFKKLFGADEPTQSRGVPIPPRPEPPVTPCSAQPPFDAPPRRDPPSRPSPLPQTTNVFRPTFTDTATISVAPGSFIDQAKHFADRTGDQAVPVPFMEYWPTYAAMSDAQLRWYFFWRTQARQGNFLPTDLSYLFLHVYEALNLIGFTAPAATFDYLVKFGEHYRILQPKLDNYLMDWLADFLIVYGLPQSPLTWYARLVTAGHRLPDQDLTIQTWLHTGGDFMTLNAHTLYELAGYSPIKNKFYQTHNQDNYIALAYKQGLQAINEYTQQLSNLSLFDQHQPKVARAIERVAFAGARYEGSKSLIKVADVYPWSSSESLAAALQQVMKYTENLLREQAGFKQRLRGIEISPNWAAVLDQAFTIPVARREIKIDLARVETLKVDSDNIRERLLAEDEPAMNGVLAAAILSTSDDSQQTAQSVSRGYTERPANTPMHLLTDLAGVAKVMGDAATTSARLLRTLREQNWLAQPAMLATVLEHQFLNVVIDEINEQAVEHLGDALLFEEDGGWVAADDYRDEIAYILDHPGYTSVQAFVPAASVPLTNNGYGELETEWASFVQQMQPLHWEGLAALLDEEDVMNRLDAVARTDYITANQLIDDINTFALNSIGDIVIDAGHDLPTIEMENIENLRMLMQWAIDHALILS